MRLIVDSLIALMLVAILATVVLHYRQEHRQFQQIRFVHQSLARLHEQAIYHRAMGQVHEARIHHTRSLNEASGFPQTISPTWFEGKLPLNVLASVRHPWLDIAPAGDRHDHPPDPVIENPDQAGFWYNPQRGVFRARVPAQYSEDRTLQLYNRVNGTALLILPHDDDPDRQPQPHSFVPGAEQRRAAQVIETTPLDEHLDAISHVLPAMLILRANEPTNGADHGDLEFEADAGESIDADAVTAPAVVDEADAGPKRPTLADRPRLQRDE